MQIKVIKRLNQGKTNLPLEMLFLKLGFEKMLDDVLLFLKTSSRASSPVAALPLESI